MAGAHAADVHGGSCCTSTKRGRGEQRRGRPSEGEGELGRPLWEGAEGWQGAKHTL